ncbi:ultraviolet-B receptor UVR8-like isoform X1 [Aristolochia californica]|uniref:ultraviolet-B receptor UVR8-like isoform X1 n=1 Tax=Aristolochia californica TaxID=171875 RepID=UPI0035E2EC1C
MDADYAYNSGNISHKIVGIAAGEAHNLVITGDGTLFSWGRGSFGRLGTGKVSDELFPVKVEFDVKKGKVLGASHEGRKPKFVGIAAGAYHSLALADDGSVWSWGYNLYGQLGLNAENSPYPCFVKQFLELVSPESLTNESESDMKGPLKVCSVKAGGMMSLAIDSQGSLWMWGSCPPRNKSEDGTFSLVSINIPQPVWDFHGHTVVKVACGTEHVVALVSTGETYSGGSDLLCYAWGNNHHGQLGVGDTEARFHPEIVEAFGQESPWLVYEIACGSNHTAVLTQNKDVLESERGEFRCWTFGLGENGQLGLGTINSVCCPKPVAELPSDVLLVSVDCGLFHTCVVSDAGDVWSWGMERGLGLCPDARYNGGDSGDALLPLRITSDEFHVSNFPRPVQVACGAAHTVLVAENGYKVWAWGRGRSGVLGRGTLMDSFTPCVVMWPPLGKDFDDERRNVSGDHTIEGKGESERKIEMERKLSQAMEEMQLVQSKLALIERYASILHTSIFRKPFEEKDLPSTLRNWGMFNVEREWENMIESADVGKLTRMAAFYRHMLAEVKDKLMKRRIEEMVKESLHSISTQK